MNVDDASAPSRRSPLQWAIKRGLATGGDLADELRDLGDYAVSSQIDALTIVAGLDLLAAGHWPGGRQFTSPLHCLTGLFQKLESSECDACAVLRERGIPSLTRIVQQGLHQPGLHAEDDLLFALKVLAMYGTAEGADTVLAAFRSGLQPDSWLWEPTLALFKPGHPQAVRVFTELSHPLPDGFIAVAMLDAANRYLLEGGDLRHPFDSDAGVARLEAWLIDSDPEHASYAVSATAALPFLNHPARLDLLRIATAHGAPAVALEGAWALAKGEDEAGIAALARHCLDLNSSIQARKYLEELGRADAIPGAALAPDFAARAAFAQWLAHPCELGRAPDEVVIVDHRTLPWPPDFTPRPLWLLRYRARAQSELDEDDEDTGLVGGVTFCLFGSDLSERPPEDAYALHCLWELEQADLAKVEAVEEEARDYDALLEQWVHGPLTAPRVESVAELSPEVPHPRRLLAVASASRKGQAGWVVLDGADSRWYAATEMPPGERAERVLSIHLGRKLLGLPETGDRSAWLRPMAKRDPGQFIVAYERVLERLSDAIRQSAAGQAAAWREVNQHFDAYLTAMTEVRGGSHEAHLLTAYECLLALARTAGDSVAEEASEVGAALSERFADYTCALIAAGRASEVGALVDFFAPRWQHNLGYSLLGKASFRAGDFARAEPLLKQLKEGMQDWRRGEEMALLAESRHRDGRVDEARNLLLECLPAVLAESRTAAGSDRELLEGWYQQFRQTWLRLFPSETLVLRDRGLPESTLNLSD